MASLTLQSMRTRVYARVESNALFYPAVDVDRAINETLETLTLVTRYRIGTVTLPMMTAPRRVFYDIPPTVIVPVDVYVDGERLEKGRLSASGILNAHWMDGVGDGYGCWIPIGPKKFALSPPDAQGGRLIQVGGMLGHTTLVADDDVVDIDDSWVDPIVENAFVWLVLKEGGKVFADAMGGFQKFQKFLEAESYWGDKLGGRVDLERQVNYDAK